MYYLSLVVRAVFLVSAPPTPPSRPSPLRPLEIDPIDVRRPGTTIQLLLAT